MRGIDLNWPQETFSPEDARAVVAAGIEFAMIGRNPSNLWARSQRQYLRDAGLTLIGEYLESMGGTFPALFAETGPVAFAVERDSGYAAKADLLEVARRIQAEGRTALCYASLASWREAGLEDDWDELAQMGVLLWCPGYHYDGQPRGPRLPRPFGGWSECVMEQYFGGTDLGDVQVPGRIEGIGYDIDLDACAPSLWGVQPAEPDEATPQAETAPPAPPAAEVAGKEFGMLIPLDMGESIGLIDRINRSAGNWISDDGVGGAFEVLDEFNGQPIPDGTRVVAVAFRERALAPVTSAEPGA